MVTLSVEARRATGVAPLQTSRLKNDNAPLALSAASPVCSVLSYRFIIASFTLRPLATCILPLISQANVASFPEAFQWSYYPHCWASSGMIEGFVEGINE
jgi:hypothetical protein